MLRHFWPFWPWKSLFFDPFHWKTPFFDAICHRKTPTSEVLGGTRTSLSYVSALPGIKVTEIQTVCNINKAVLEPRVSPAFAITYFCNHCNIRFKNTSKYVDTLPFFPKTWTKGHWPLDDLWPHVCWGHMCDSTQGSLCPSPMTIHQCMWIQWSILQITTYIHILRTYYVHTTYRMSDHIVSYWTQFRRDKNTSSKLARSPWQGGSNLQGTPIS